MRATCSVHFQAGGGRVCASADTGAPPRPLRSELAINPTGRVFLLGITPKRPSLPPTSHQSLVCGGGSDYTLEIII